MPGVGGEGRANLQHGLHKVSTQPVAGSTLCQGWGGEGRANLPHGLHKVSTLPVAGSTLCLGEGWCLDRFSLDPRRFGLHTYGDLHTSQQNGLPTKIKKNIFSVVSK